jgi:hypothetical protein
MSIDQWALIIILIISTCYFIVWVKDQYRKILNTYNSLMNWLDPSYFKEKKFSSQDLEYKINQLIETKLSLHVTQKH